MAFIPHYPTALRVTSYYNYSTYNVGLAVDPELPLTGYSSGNSWMSSSFTLENKFSFDLGEAFTISRVYLENFHSKGALTERGVKNVQVYGTNVYNAFNNTTYSNTDDLTLIQEFEAAAHIAADAADPQYFTISSPGSYRYYVLRIQTTQGDLANVGIRHIELQEETVSSASFPPITAAGKGGGRAVLSLPVEASGAGGGIGDISIPAITISGTGRNTTFVTVGGTIGYELTGGFTLESRTPVQIGGRIPYDITGGFQMDRTEIGGTIPYEITGGLTMHSHVGLNVGGRIPYDLQGGFEIFPHVPITVGGRIPYDLQGGFEIEVDRSISIGGRIPYDLEGGFSIHDVPQLEIGGTIPYALRGGFSIDSGATCSGVMQYAEETRC